MKGLKDFVLRGNLVELAVAFVMGAAFATVVTALVDVIMDLVGKVGGRPDFSDYEPGGVSIGAFLTALIAFMVLAAVVYFLIVTPYTKAKQVMQRTQEEVTEATPDDIRLLTEIRDLLASRAGGPNGSGQV
jgi:large conductance mechanosensitive channel